MALSRMTAWLALSLTVEGEWNQRESAERFSEPTEVMREGC